MVVCSSNDSLKVSRTISGVRGRQSDVSCDPKLDTMRVHHAEHPVSCFSRKDAGLLGRASNMPDVLINFELIW